MNLTSSLKIALAGAALWGFSASAQNALIENNRMLWGSITKSGENLTNMNDLKVHRGKLLLSWRMLPAKARTQPSTSTKWKQAAA